MKRISIQRPQPLEFMLADGRSIIVPPPTRGQVREALTCDPEEGVALTPVENAAQIALQLAALMGEQVRVNQPADNETAHREIASSTLVDSFTYDEATDMLAALLCYGVGQDPAQTVAIHQTI